MTGLEASIKAAYLIGSNPMVVDCTTERKEPMTEIKFLLKTGGCIVLQMHDRELTLPGQAKFEAIMSQARKMGIL